MPHVFVLASDPAAAVPTGPVGLLAAALPADRVRLTVRAVALRHGFDVAGLRALRRDVVHTAPTVLHAWGPSAARVGALLRSTHPKGSPTPRLVVSAAADPGAGFTGWLTAQAVRRADRVTATTAAEADRYRRLGVPDDCIVRVAPAVVPPGPPPDPTAFRHDLGIPPHARLVMAGDRLDRASGLKDAVWAFDILRYDQPDLYLVLVGDGSDRGNLERFGRALAFDDFKVRFAGNRPGRAALWQQADMVWVTRDRGGADLAREAQAAGRPVIGWNTPELAEAVTDGETGLLVPPADRVALAGRARALLEDPATAARLGIAGRDRVLDAFPPRTAAEQFARLYEGLSAPTTRADAGRRQ